MRQFSLLLRLIAPGFLLASALHLWLGAGADVLLGAELPPEAIADPALDSQNRFYGAAFALYGVLLVVCASDVPRHANVLRCLLWTLFAAGAARGVSFALYGSPPPLVVVLALIELVLPVALLLWLSRLRATVGSTVST